MCAAGSSCVFCFVRVDCLGRVLFYCFAIFRVLVAAIISFDFSHRLPLSIYISTPGCGLAWHGCVGGGWFNVFFFQSFAVGKLRVFCLSSVGYECCSGVFGYLFCSLGCVSVSVDASTYT